MKKLFAVMILLVGCISTQYRETVDVERDNFDGSITLRGAEQRLLKNGSRCFLRTFYNPKTRTANNQLFVIIYYSHDWRIYYSVYSRDNSPYRFIPIADDVWCNRGCTYTEQFAIAIPVDDMAQHPGGMDFRVYCKKGDPLIIHLTSEQIRLQLESIKLL